MYKTCITATIVIPYTNRSRTTATTFLHQKHSLFAVSIGVQAVVVGHLSSRTLTTRMKEVPGNGDGQTGAHDTLAAVDTSPATD